MLATKMRDDMAEVGQTETLDILLKEARQLQDDLQRGTNE